MDRIEAFLKERAQNNLLRTLEPIERRKNGKIHTQDHTYVDLSSNDYLGLSSHPKLKEAAKEAAEVHGTSASASRLLSGNLKLHHDLEEKTALFKNAQASLVFNSGYQANVSILGALYGTKDAIFSDRLNHASLLDGIRLSGAKLFRFRHNDVDHLTSLLKKERGKFQEALIVTETVFSMDGDMAPLEDLARLKTQHNCRLMVDEAHATGLFGKHGSGLVEEKGLAREVDLTMGTFGKALGSFGAYLACSKKMRDYLINACRGFIYSTALPPAVIAANLASLDLITQEPLRRRTVLDNARCLRDALAKNGFRIKGESQILPLILGQTEKTVRLSQELRKRGWWTLPIRPPTVPVGEARLRFSITYDHSKQILAQLIHDLSDINHL